MNAGARLAAFGAALAVVFGASALAGAAIDPDRGDSSEARSTPHEVR